MKKRIRSAARRGAARRGRKGAEKCPCCGAAPCACETTCFCQELKADLADDETDDDGFADELRLSYERYAEAGA